MTAAPFGPALTAHAGGYEPVEVVLWGVVLVSGLVGGLGAAYLLYVDTIVVHYTTYFRTIATGLLGFAVTAPVVFAFAPGWIHAVHALAVVCISVGLYSLSDDRLEPADSFEEGFTTFEDGTELGPFDEGIGEEGAATDRSEDGD